MQSKEEKVRQTSFLLIAEGVRKQQGTCWFLDKETIVTAWHVVAPCCFDEPPPEVFSGFSAGSSVFLQRFGREFPLELVRYWTSADLALLRPQRNLSQTQQEQIQFLSLATVPSEIHDHCSAKGFPRIGGGEALSLLAEVADNRGETESKRLQLQLPNERTTWKGVSGSALLNQEGGVVGVITSEFEEGGIGVDTLFATDLRSLKRVVGEGANNAQESKMSKRTVDPQGWYANPPFPWVRAEAQELKRILKQAYPSLDRIRVIGAVGGVDLSEVNMHGAVDGIWHSLLESAARQGKMVSLLEAILRDGSVAGHHNSIWTVLGR